MGKTDTWRKLLELCGLFLKLGTIGFGGPAVLIGLMEQEVVRVRKWLDRQEFLDLLGVTHLIPGPNAVEMAIHIGFRRAGWLGLLGAGLTFILPATLISLGLGWGYVTYGRLPEVEPLLRGIKPAVWVILVTALIRLAATAMRRKVLMLLGALVAIASLAGGDEVTIFLVGSLLGAVVLRRLEPPSPDVSPVALAASPISPVGSGAAWSLLGTAAHAAASGSAVSLWKLGLFFLKIGAILYGSGYVLVAYLQDDLVLQYGWLTQRQLLDAIAVGQFTPGPILCTVTFVGYVVAGLPGGLVATAGAFLPAFLIVAVIQRWIPKLRRSVWAARFLDAVNAVSVGLMGAVAWVLGQNTFLDRRDWLIFLLASALVFRWKVSPAWVVLAGGLAGVLLYP